VLRGTVYHVLRVLLYMYIQHKINLYSLHKRAHDVLCMRKKRQPRTSLHMINCYGRLCKNVPKILAVLGSCVRGRVFTDRTSQCSESATVRHGLSLNLNFNFTLCTGYHISDIAWLENATKFRLKYPNDDFKKPDLAFCHMFCHPMPIVITVLHPTKYLPKASLEILNTFQKL
jgi:hypothetical protein